MRLWHYEIIPFLPKNQLVAQWRELNSIFKKQDKHILINYIYEYPKNDLYTYTIMITQEMIKRGYKIKIHNNFYNFFGIDATTCVEMVDAPFKNHHNYRYLLQCFYNLQEKYDRGQEYFSEEQYIKLEKFVRNYLYKPNYNKLNIGDTIEITKESVTKMLATIIDDNPKDHPEEILVVINNDMYGEETYINRKDISRVINDGKASNTNRNS